MATQRKKAFQFTEMLKHELGTANASKMREMIKIVLEDALVNKNLATIWKIIDRIEGTAVQRIVQEQIEMSPEKLEERLQHLLKKALPTPPLEIIIEELPEELPQI